MIPPSFVGESRTIDLDGPVHYVDLGGPPEGPLLVGLHGLGGSHLNWAAVGPALSRRSRVVALDLVGHGLTPVGRRTADIEGHRRLVSGFLQALGGSPAVLVGSSMGGLVAALQAVREPDSVAGLILVDPALPTARLGLVHPRVVANFLLCAMPGVGEGYLTQRRRRTTAEQTVRRVLGVCCVDASRVPEDVVGAHIELTARIDRAAADAAYLRSARSLSMVMARPREVMATLRTLTQPTLLLQGARDVLVPLSAARHMSAAHPDWRFEVARDIGHVPMLEAPEWTTGVIESWLAREGGPAAERAAARVTAGTSVAGVSEVSGAGRVVGASGVADVEPG
ncbi:MAG: alpha/beta fold hydrolase [Acidimicrobiales bacterium]